MSDIRAKVRVDIRGLTALRDAAAKGNRVPEMQAMYRQWAKRYEAFTVRRFNTFSRGGGEWPPLALSTINGRRVGGASRGGVDQGGGRNARRNGRGLGAGARSSLARDTRPGRGNDGTLTAGTGQIPFGRLVKAPGAGRAVSILADTGLLRNSLTIGAVGNRLSDLPKGVQFGFAATPHAPKKAASKGRRYGGSGRRGGSVARARGSGSAKPLSFDQLATIHHFGSVEKKIPARPILVLPTPDVVRGMEGDAARALRSVVARTRGGQR